ncbi:MAG: peroxide stress protein YaaA [Cryobacterium sp.]|nr:peroxide stress protein YaaA [Cryobacterium sp.]
MLVLLPPSETKRDGGVDDSSLELGALSFAELNPVRTRVLAAVRALSTSRRRALAALGLSDAQAFEVDRNRALRTSPVMPAIERYTGVLFDAIDWQTVPDAARGWAHDHAVIHSALFGLLRAGDPIPAYRLSHDSRLVVREQSLKRTWANPVASALAATDEFVLDLRSEGYAGLGPAPKGSYFVRVVTEGSDGVRRALNHFNKKGKGEFVRALMLAGLDHGSVESLLEWAADAGCKLDHGAPGELDLVV